MGDLMNESEGVPLADYIRVLRDQLETAQEDGQGRGVRFGVGAVELEFEVAVTREAGGKGGLKLWVAELGAEGKRSGVRTQRVRMTLTPTDEDGRPLSVTDRLPEPPR
ncbi:trypco2 family protein [Nonomuraea sp. NPDC049709]|uniref:trypco2 family protein n=1 Tax=Nonomuraea sp. NPDC049709 TaxID=3154736 RepID=UPI00343E1599